MNTITADDVARLSNDGRTLNLLDVRTPPEFDRLHATGARFIPLDSLNASTAADLRCSDVDPLYVLCHSGPRAAKACEKLAAMGVGPAICVAGGTVAWERARLPLSRGMSKVISLERQVRIAAGSLVLVGLGLALWIHPAFAGISAFVGAGLVFAGMTDFCGMGMLLAKLPWNRRDQNACAVARAAKIV